MSEEKTVDAMALEAKVRAHERKKRKKAGDKAERRKRQNALKELNAQPSAQDAMTHRLPGSFESGNHR